MSSSTNIDVALVDDDESLCRSLGRVLRAFGIRAVFFHSGEDFIAKSARTHFDCLLLDIQLDGISGIELNQRLVAAGSHTPVIFLTAHNEPDIREQALRTPCVAYLRKSDPAEAVVSTIRKAVAGKTAGSDRTPLRSSDSESLQNQDH